LQASGAASCLVRLRQDPDRKLYVVFDHGNTYCRR
jgi:hypothetical protein